MPIKSEGDEKDEKPKILSQREMVRLFMVCGIDENIAQDIIKSHPEMVLTNKHVEDYKLVLREAMNVLEREGVPENIVPVEKDTTSRQNKIAVCKICKDSAAIHATFPENMKKFFRITHKFRGDLTKEDWLCKSCYGEWYRDNRELLKESNEQPSESETEQSQEEERKGPRKEQYMKCVAYPLYIAAVNLHPKALSHRKMLVRYICLNMLHMDQIPTALYYLRKIGSGIIEEEDFIRICGIGQWEDLFMYGTWREKNTEIEIFHRDEQKKKKQQEKKLKKEQEEIERKKQEEEMKKENEKQKQLKELVEKQENETIQKLRVEKKAKLVISRKKEDEDIQEERNKEDIQKKKKKDKKENEMKLKKKDRDQELKEAEANIKKREEEIKKRKEERLLKQQSEATKRAAERSLKAELLKKGLA